VGIEERLNNALREVRPLRDTHSKAVAEAFRPQGIEAAKAMIHGLHMFVTAAQKFNACEGEIGTFGGDPQRIFIAGIITNYGDFCRRFLLEGDR
jgi:hypothetical protein